jgi:prolyl oligopeptidase
MVMAVLDYPPATRSDVVDVLHGRSVADPYRWLEDASSDQTHAWSAAQEALTEQVLRGLPGREALATRLTDLLSTGAVSAPAWRAGRAFWTRRDPGQEHAVLRWRDSGGGRVAADVGEEHVLLDPMEVDASGSTTLDAWMPSKEGRRIACQVSSGGSEESLLQVVDVASREILDGPIDRCRYSPIAWLPGGEAFYYVRRLPPEEVPPGEQEFHRRVWLHRVGTSTEQDVEVWGDGLDMTNYYGCSVSQDGRWLLVTASAGTAPRDDVWLFDLTAGGPPAEVQVAVDAGCSPWISRDGRLWLLTDADAPRGRLCVADPEQPRAWTTVLAEDADAVLEDVELVEGPAGPLLVALRSRHAISELSVHDLDGWVLREVELPGLGSVAGLSSEPEGGTSVWFGWTDATTPPRVHRLDASAGEVTLWSDSPGRVDLGEISAQLVDFPSYDGTVVRAQVLSRSGAPDTPRPTVLYGYGGFGVPLSPGYTASALAWVEAGGVWVVANLRGGTEEGEQWHRAGMRAGKQNVFDDFAACADHLVKQGWTTPEQLGIYGGSNGGLLVGAALTQRPSAYAAAVCSAPLLDMVRYEQFGFGRIWNDEFGTAEHPEELGWLLSYSPYHAVQPETPYPAVLFTVFEGDTRVDTLHARKMCAALQAATTSTSPVLLRSERGVGHGARALSRTVGLAADTLSFLAAHTGLEV